MIARRLITIRQINNYIAHHDNQIKSIKVTIQILTRRVKTFEMFQKHAITKTVFDFVTLKIQPRSILQKYIDGNTMVIFQLYNELKAIKNSTKLLNKMKTHKYDKRK